MGALSGGTRQRLPLVLAVVALVPTTVVAFGDGDLAVGGAALVVITLNLVALRLMTRIGRSMTAVINLANALLAFVIAHDAWRDGKTGLPYAWVAAGGMFLVVAGAGLRAGRVTTSESDQG